MDISAIRPGEIQFDMRHPGTNKKLGITVGLVSIDDDRLKKLLKTIQNEGLALQKRGKVFTADQVEENTKRILFAAMTGWAWTKAEDEKDANGDVVKGEEALFEGEKPAFNEANVRKVFDTAPWFKDQINEQVGETKSFFSA